MSNTFPIRELPEVIHTSTLLNKKIFERAKLREAVLLRDVGICALCGLDTSALWQAISYCWNHWESILTIPLHVEGVCRAFKITNRLPPAPERKRGANESFLSLGEGVAACRIALAAGLFMKPLKFEEWKKGLGKRAESWPGELWEADHILPSSQRGLEDLTNHRTLCLSCHCEETARLIYGKRP